VRTPDRSPLATLSLWRVSVLTAYLPPTGAQTVVSSPVASIGIDFDITLKVVVSQAPHGTLPPLEDSYSTFYY
jgi:hypothetical protein